MCAVALLGMTACQKDDLTPEPTATQNQGSGETPQTPAETDRAGVYAPESKIVSISVDGELSEEWNWEDGKLMSVSNAAGQDKVNFTYGADGRVNTMTVNATDMLSGTVTMTYSGESLSRLALDGANSVTVTLLSDESEHEARLVGTDSVSDLAVLKIEAQDLKPAEFGQSDSLQVGDDVIAIGNPLGTELNGTMTNGIVSAINRNVIFGGHSMTLIQTNAAINEGNSGGPLINEHGQVVGVTNMKAFTTGVEGICFAIPTSVIQPVVDALIADGQVNGRASIGIVIGALDAAAAEYYDLPQGLYVESVAEGSDAEKQGIQPGDIVTAVNGQTVTTTYEVNAIKEAFSVGDTMTLTIYRDGETFDVTVTLMDTNDVY